MIDRASTEKCLRLIDRGLRERGYEGRPRYRYIDDGSGPVRLIGISRQAGRVTVGLNFVPRALIQAWEAVGHWWMDTDIHDKGDTANLGFWARLDTLTSSAEHQDGWREVERSDQVQTMADEVLALFNEYAEPWFARLAGARAAVEATRGWYMSEALMMEAAILLADTPTLRGFEVADNLDAFVRAEPSERDEIYGARLMGPDLRAAHWLADQLRRRAGTDQSRLQDPTDWPSRGVDFYCDPAKNLALYEEARKEVHAAMGAIELDLTLLERPGRPRRSRKRPAPGEHPPK
jgi:hypothetical protein